MIFYGALSGEASIVSKINPTPGERNTLLPENLAQQNPARKSLPRNRYDAS